MLQSPTIATELRNRCPWSSIDSRDAELFILVKRIQFLGQNNNLYSLPNSLIEKLEFINQLLTLQKEAKNNGP